MKLVFKNIILLFISILVTLATVWIIGELLLRGAIKYEMVDTKEMYVRSKNEILNRELKSGYKGIYYGCPVEINSAGLRDYEYDIDKPKGIYRIALLGDSMCFGQGLTLDDTYPKVLERLLNSNNSYNATNIQKIEVLNFSVPGYGTIQEFEYLKTKAIFYKPDLIILNFCLNDILPIGSSSLPKPPSKSASIHRRFMNKVASIKAKSYFAQYILSRMAVLTRRMGMHGGYISDFYGAYENDSEFWLKCREQILNIKRFTEDEEIAILVVIIPFLSDLNEHHPLKKEIDIVANFCKVNKIDSVNLLPYFYEYKAESLWINPINGHPNEKAHKIMTEALSVYILNKWL